MNHTQPMVMGAIGETTVARGRQHVTPVSLILQHTSTNETMLEAQ